MMHLTPEQLAVVRQYAALLDTMEEGFAYVVESFHHYERTQGDAVLADLFTALGRIHDVNERLLSRFFAENAAIMAEIRRFSAVEDEAWKLDGKLQDANVKQQLVETRLAPAFEAWKASMLTHLRPYVEQ
ncbi:hypothetical protein [Anoxybacteroides rupiense]|uniref:hypothetical protein n=1 Tax=Anoxybacteroides rupiense TaxID=311460 RepID=UPI001F09C636|nr:hypothetical protein [Anoxybacillus rupiensis]